MKVNSILIVTANRAEKGLLDPVMHEFVIRKNTVEVDWFNVSELFSTHNEFNIPEMLTLFHLAIMHKDVMVMPCDRWEMTYLAAYAYHQNKIVCHFHAGNNPTNHPDDMNRRAISAFSHIMFCNLEEHRQNLIRQGEEPWRIHTVGSTILDHINIDYSACPNYDFDLVILHPDPLSKENTELDLKKTINLVRESPRHTIWIMPNHDVNYEIIVNMIVGTTKEIFNGTSVYENFVRPQFLGLLQKCKRAIGNSSSFYYELPTLNPEAKVVHIGTRNLNLPAVTKITAGASKKIVDIILNLEVNDRLKRKKLITNVPS